MIGNLNRLCGESILPDFEDGKGKSEILDRVSAEAKAAIGSGELFTKGLAAYGELPELKALWAALGGKPLFSADAVVDAISDKKAVEILRLTTLRHKMIAEVDAIRREADALKEERAHLGIFRGKRKREIDQLLEQIPARIREAEEKYEREKKSL